MGFSDDDDVERSLSSMRFDRSDPRKDALRKKIQEQKGKDIAESKVTFGSKMGLKQLKDKLFGKNDQSEEQEEEDRDTDTAVPKTKTRMEEEQEAVLDAHTDINQEDMMTMEERGEDVDDEETMVQAG